MKKVLITGVNSYVGNSLEKWLLREPDQYSVEKISLRDGTWKTKDFSEFYVVVHVAGIAHVSRNPKMEELYYKVNRDLTIEVANKAKSAGVRQFIFLSSIIVYGENIGKGGLIDKNTQPNPSSFYGMSKLQAEEGILCLQDEDFKVVIIRPPMIYGKGSKGNYPKLSKLARFTPVFPKVTNKRSMIHIENLCEFIKQMLENSEKGIFFPQNEDYVNTSELVREIATVYNKKVYFVTIFNPIIKVFVNKKGYINKLFGNLYYDKSLSKYKRNYHINDFKKSILFTERNVKGK